MPMDHTNTVAEALEEFITPPPRIAWGRVALLFIIIGLAHVVAHFYVWRANGFPVDRPPVVDEKSMYEANANWFAKHPNAKSIGGVPAKQAEEYWRGRHLFLPTDKK